jgi:hypothetical protein
LRSTGISDRVFLPLLPSPGLNRSAARVKIQSREKNKMNPDPSNLEWLKSMKKKVEEEIARKEMECLLYWKTEAEKILTKRAQTLASLQLEFQELLQRMQNRIKVLKSTLP